MTNEECAALKQANGCKETLDLAAFLSRIKSQEGYDIAIVITPNGAKSITTEILELEGE